MHTNIHTERYQKGAVNESQVRKKKKSTQMNTHLGAHRPTRGGSPHEKEVGSSAHRGDI